MKNKTVFLVPLNWGLGHVTRCIPIIRQLIKQGNLILLGGSPAQRILLNEEFPDIKTIPFPYARVKIGKSRFQHISLFWQVPLFYFQIIKEHRALKRVIRNYNIDVVISDNCFGLWDKSIHSIFISHQINILLPPRLKYFTKPVNKINRWFIQKFDECWIPDVEDSGGYAGKLSHDFSLESKIKYLGILSRFSNLKITSRTVISKMHPKILILISGPENQRTLFEEIIREQMNSISDKYECTIVRGLPGKKTELNPGWYNHKASGELMKEIINADAIICRSGYSTIMDLIALKKTALLVPTPGQSEQEYLAEYLSAKKLFLVMDQKNFDLNLAVRKLLSPVSQILKNQLEYKTQDNESSG